MTEKEDALRRIMQRDTGLPKTGAELLEEFILNELIDLNRRLTKLRNEEAELKKQLSRVRLESRPRKPWRKWWWRKKR